MIVSRCESLAIGKTVDDAFQSCHAYAEAGYLDGTIHSKEKSGEDIMSFGLCQVRRSQFITKSTTGVLFEMRNLLSQNNVGLKHSHAVCLILQWLNVQKPS